MAKESGIKLSTMTKMVGDFLISNDERIFLDWLIYNQNKFGIGNPFRHSIPEIQKETHIARFSQTKILNKFAGFVYVDITYYQNNPYTTYSVNFELLSQQLGRLIKDGTPTYDLYLKQIKEWAKEQKKATKPPSKREVKEKEQQEAEINAMIDVLDNVWCDRIKMYNSGELTGEVPSMKKKAVQLARTKNAKNTLSHLMETYDIRSIKCSFVAFADDVLTGEISPNNLLLYFVKSDGHGYPVMENYLACFNACYS
ncbi:MAG: hypothetical protein ACI3YI_13185 [Bacteroidaceae bacterium]